MGLAILALASNNLPNSFIYNIQVKGARTGRSFFCDGQDRVELGKSFFWGEIPEGDREPLPHSATCFLAVPRSQAFVSHGST